MRRIEALADDGAYAVAFRMPDNQERSVLLRVADGIVSIPEANLIPGWAADSPSSEAALSAIAAVHAARALASSDRSQLLDLPGGWDVTLGNVVLSGTGQPNCVSHGGLDETEPSRYQCPVCGAAALYQIAS
jgi:hypothetical protein